MTINKKMLTLVSHAKTTFKPVITTILTGLLFAMTTANATSEMTAHQPMSASTTIVEQPNSEKVATITSLPAGITMKDGVPFYVTQVTTVPRYSIPKTNDLKKNTPQPSTSKSTTTVTSVPVTNTTSSTTVISLDTLQLNPVFSVPNQVNANTKIMKLLKNSAGREVAVPANHVVSGDIIEYHITYTATTSLPLTGLNATSTIPNGIKLLSLISPLPTLAAIGDDRYQIIQQANNTMMIEETYSSLQWNLISLVTDVPQTVIIRAQVQ